MRCVQEIIVYLLTAIICLNLSFYTVFCNFAYHNYKLYFFCNVKQNYN